MKRYFGVIRSSLLLMTGFSLLAILTMVSCSPRGSQATADPVQNINWQWVSVTDASTGTKTVVPNQGNYTINFYPDGTLTGKADCNTFSGTYSQQNGFSIKLGPSTQMYCGDASLDLPYLQLLNSVAAGGPDGAGGLALETAGGAQRILFKNGGKAPKP